MSEKAEQKNWLARQAESQAKKDVMPMSERWGQVAPVTGILIVLLFFLIHQNRPTGLFTPQFGTAETVLLYAPMVLVLLTMVTRMVIGRKNVVRPFDAVAFAFVAVATIWLYVVFPFNFTNLADVLPSFLQFILTWITDSIARIVMILQILGSAFFAGYTAMLYIPVRQELSKPQSRK